MKPPHDIELHVKGKSLYENIGHGQTCTYIRVDSRGKFVPGYDEKIAAYIAHAANMYPELVEALEDLANIARAVNAEQHAGIKIDGERWSDLYDTEAKARALLAKAGEA